MELLVAQGVTEEQAMAGPAGYCSPAPWRTTLCEPSFLELNGTLRCGEQVGSCGYDSPRRPAHCDTSPLESELPTMPSNAL